MSATPSSRLLSFSAFLPYQFESERRIRYTVLGRGPAVSPRTRSNLGPEAEKLIDNNIANGCSPRYLEVAPALLA